MESIGHAWLPQVYHTHLSQVLRTVRVVAVDVPPLALVQPVAIVDDADLSKTTVGASFDYGVAHSSFVEPARRAHMKPCAGGEQSQTQMIVLND